MRILITGMTAQHVKAENRDKTRTVASALEDALIRGGHDVKLEPYSIEKSLSGETSKADVAFVGLGPLKGLGTAYMYQAIQAIHDHGSNVVLYVDDTDTAKIGREFKTVLKRPSDYAKPFFMYKREWSYVQDSSSDLFKNHMNVIDALAGNQNRYWPVLVPSWTFDLGYTAAAKISTHAANSVISFDPSAHFAFENLERVERVENEVKTWGTMYPTTSPALGRMGVHSWDVECIKGSPARISEMDGFLVPSPIWTPEVQRSASLGVPVAADWKTLGPQLGAPFEALPSAIEMMDFSSRKELAKQQSKAMAYRAAYATVDAVSVALDALK